MANSRTEAKELLCLFKFLVEDYLGKKVGDSVFFIPMKKNKKKIELSNNEPNFCDFEIQVSLLNPEYEKKINKLELLNKQLLLENEILKKQLNNKYDNQQQETLAGNSEPFPNGLVFMAFDNELKGQKNYLDREYKKVIFHMVTSFVLFNFDPTNQIQNFENSWLHQNLNMSQIENLFGLTSEIQVLLDRQLHDYLSNILTKLCKEKKEDINVIDNLVINQSAGTSKQKQCCECGKTEIENSKRKCSQCHAKLPTLAETQQEKNKPHPIRKTRKIQISQ
ncbi:hypothetical protein F8M41_003508 [Gigaspora margarita]|uniref:Uncharacterized protein n=1 Tax=Gigaspora margarita TaxID=4874 RepID=A0A8H3XBZ1_GIGMA|nr:hypothetical protein F8M41_003508 [Gigaspora margarita]